jgi:hypothetical protein
MKFTNLIIICIISLTVIGCDEDSWLKIEKAGIKGSELASQGEKVAVSTSFLTGPYGQAAIPILGAISAISTAIATLASKKTKKVAKAASEAAEALPGGGKALIASSTKHNVVTDIVKAYELAKKIGG